VWAIDRSASFAGWIKALDLDGKEAIYKNLLLLRSIGPSLGRPYVDLVARSRYPNMKELRVQNKQRLFRILFAFDPRRTAILLAGGDKRGDKRFYERMIPLADSLFERHLAELERWHEKK
jgi:hypothetical protein